MKSPGHHICYFHDFTSLSDGNFLNFMLYEIWQQMQSSHASVLDYHLTSNFRRTLESKKSLITQM